MPLHAKHIDGRASKVSVKPAVIIVDAEDKLGAAARTLSELAQVHAMRVSPGRSTRLRSAPRDALALVVAGDCLSLAVAVKLIAEAQRKLPRAAIIVAAEPMSPRVSPESS